MTDITPEKLAELRAVAEAATEGPWTTFDSKGEAYSTPPATGAMLVDYGADVDQQMRDVRHIAAFDPPTVLSFIAALEVKTDEVEGLRDELAAWMRSCQKARLRLDQVLAELERWQAPWNREDGYRIDCSEPGADNDE